MKPLTFGDPETVLRGQIYTDYVYGRSGYGETPEIDELEHAILLALDTPIAIPARAPRYEGDFESIGCANVRFVQLAGAVDIQHLRDIRGHGVEITGSLFHSHTGHHHAEVLIDIHNRVTSILDDRNTYAGARCPVRNWLLTRPRRIDRNCGSCRGGRPRHHDYPRSLPRKGYA